MDTFMNIAQQGFKAYQESQSGGQQQHHQQGPPPDYQEQEQRHHQPQQQQQYNYEGGEVQDRRYRDEGNYQGPNLDHDDVVNQAASHGGNSGDPSLFSKAMQHISHNKAEHTQPIDEQGVQEAHRQAYERSDAGSLDSGSMGAAAAMQALKMFTQGGGGSGGGGGTSNLISMAMGEASKLFDASGGSASGNKQDVVNGAAMTMMKLVVQSKFGGGGFMGGGNSGGISGLMGLASKFM